MSPLEPPTPPSEIPPAAEIPAQPLAGLNDAVPATATTIASEPSRRSRFGVLGLSHKHTAASATLLLSAFALLSRVIGLIRDKYIAYTFGAGPQTDAYNIAFNLPDLVNYLLIGGAASISFVTILSRYREQGRDEEGEIALSVILNTMALVLGAALLIAEFLAPLYIRVYSKGDPAQDALAVYMTRILLPGQLFFFAGGVLASVALVRKQFGYQAISPLVYSAGIIVGGVIGARWLGIPSLAWGALAGAICGPFLVNAFAARRAGVRWRPVFDRHNEGLRDWVKMSIPMMFGVTIVFMDTQILQFFAKHETGDITRLMNAKKLFTAPMAIIGQAAGAASLPFFATLFSANKMEEFRGAVGRSVTRIASRRLASRIRDGSPRGTHLRPGATRRPLHARRLLAHRDVPRHLLSVARAVELAGDLHSRLLCSRADTAAHGCWNHHHRRVAAGVLGFACPLRSDWARRGLRIWRFLRIPQRSLFCCTYAS